MISTLDIYALVEERRAELGLSQAELEFRAFGKSGNGSVQNLRRGKAPGIERLGSLLETLGLEMYIGRPRPDFSQNGKIDPVLTKGLSDAIAEDFAYIQRFDVQLSAGPGTNGNNARELSPVAFRRDWMLQQGLVANQCAVCSVTGSSMEPLLFGGDLALIDRRRTDLKNNQVYAVVDVEGDVRIKRLEKIEGGILLRSDNPTSRTEARMGDDANRIDIIGKLAWSGHTHDALHTTKTG